MPSASQWPKVFPPLTPEQKARSDGFMKLWHEVLPRRYSIFERFNHGFPVRASAPGFVTTLEIGAGLGEHLGHEVLTPEQQANYYLNDFRETMLAEARRRHPTARTVPGDCQQPLPFAEGFFDRVLAIHVLEHLPDLPAAIREVYRMLNKARGQFLVVIPTEGGLAYGLARRISAQRVWNQHYAPVPYAEFIGREHINVPAEILAELAPYFEVRTRRFFPFPWLPLPDCNLCIGLDLKPRTERVLG